MVDQEISHERCHHRVSQARAPLSQTESAKDSGHYQTPALSAEHLTATGHDAAPPKLRVLTGRSHRAGKRTNRRGPNRRWMGVQWRVTRVLPRAQNLAAMTVRLATKEFTRPRRAGCSVISMQKRFYDLVGTIQEHLHHRADRPIF
jgi:hypothetical protein